jgi:uncharacterized iron-regulated membrane protein
MKRWLFLVHRWVGIALCLVMALWFLSGMVMLYVGYPKLTPEEQLAGLPALPARMDYVSPAQAAQASGLARVQHWRLSSVAGQPRYLLSDGPKTQVAVDALSGQRIQAVSQDQAVAAARHFAHGAAAHSLGQVQEDAWTHSRALDIHRPLWRVAVQDQAQRWLYVSGRSGEVVRDASATERHWGWVGAWLHWLYLFRGGALDSWWSNIVIWGALAGGVLALSGLIVGLWRWRFRGRYKSGSRSPYREPWARWHHVLGLCGGVLALTWVLSGLFSMNPWKIFEARGPKPDRLALAGGLLSPEQAAHPAPLLASLHTQGLQPRQLEWRLVNGQPAVLLHLPGGQRLVDAQGQALPPLSEAQLVAAAERLLPGHRVLRREWLREYDRYYYAREAHTMTGQRERPLPALRLVLDDAQAHWVVLDPRSGAVLQLSHQRERASRWLFAFLHSFDLPALLATRPLWDAWMLGFSLAGLGLSLSGVVLGWRRLRRRHPSAIPVRHPAASISSPKETHP